MKKYIWLFVIGFLIFSVSIGKSQVVQDYQIQNGQPDRSGLVGNGITDLLWADSVLYAGTGFGLSKTENLGESWQNFTPNEYGGKGGISALIVSPDGTVWIATAYDTTVQDDENLSAGGGLRYLPPGESEWIFIPQPKDARGDTLDGMKPTTTNIQNVTFDIAILDTQIWITSFGGGIRRSLDMGESWEVITTDGKPFSSLNNLNHRGFSAMTENGNIWIGTADGISKSEDGGENWERYRVRNQNPESGEISGNWIIDLAYNPWNNSVWAVTLTTGGDEFNSISRSLDGGTTWKNFLVDELSDGTFARDIAFRDSAVYVATENGVFKTINDGETWYRFGTMTDRISGEQILTETFYSVSTSPLEGLNHRLWVGSADGLSMTADNGYSWTIYRSFVSTLDRSDPAVYAYPNPFSPMEGDVLRFQYDMSASGNVEIEIFNFAMERVIAIREAVSSAVSGSFDRSTQWDGRDNNGRLVDNGVYFFRAEVEGEVNWGKIVVIN